MRASGMTDEEIGEIIDMEAEKINTNIDRESELKEIQEIMYLEGQA